MHLIPSRIVPANRLERLEQQGVSRRDFLKFCAGMAAVLAVPATHTSLISRALAAAPRLPMVWLAFQDCTGDSESFLRSGDPTVTTILLDLVSLDYHETLMAPSGAQAEKSLYDTLATYPGGYVAVVEGSIPTAANGFYCAIGGRSSAEHCAAGVWFRPEDDRRRRLCVGWRLAGGRAQPNGSGRRAERGARPQPHQHARLPHQCSQFHGRHRSVPYLRALARG